MQTIFRTYQKGTSISALTSTKSVLNAQSYKHARYYDSDIARFLSLDQKASKYPSLSAYNYVGAMPIIAIDPDGKDIIIIVNKTGSGGENNPGHTMIGVTVYDEAGNPTGYMKVYDLHPDRWPSGVSAVPGNIKHSVQNIDEFLEARGDEYIILKTTKEQDDKSLKFLEVIETSVNAKRKL